jgi:hypothetical protein
MTKPTSSGSDWQATQPIKAKSSRRGRTVFAAATVIAATLSLPTATISAGTSQDSKGSPALVQAKLKPVLAPDQYFGTASQAYQAAKQCPEICAKLFCWCGCDLTDAHTSLLDCFTSDHGADCEICQKEAFLALEMKKQGKSVSDIQRAVDTKYEKNYPYDHPSPALMRYRKDRLWKSAADQPQSSIATSSTPKLLPGKTAGSCCGAHDKASALK